MKTGNIGIPVLNLRDDAAHTVLELSSYQIEISACIDCKVSVLLNLSPDHLDRYPAYRDYVDAKLRLLDPSKTHGLAEGFNNSLNYANDSQSINEVNMKYSLFYADDPLQSEFVANKQQQTSRGKQILSKIDIKQKQVFEISCLCNFEMIIGLIN